MRPKKHPYRNSRSKSQRLRRAKEIIRNLLPKTQIAETQLLGVEDFENPCSFPRNETATRPGCSKDIPHSNLNIQPEINLENECSLPENGMSSLINEGTVNTPNFSERSAPSLDNATVETQPYTVERIMCRKRKILSNKRVVCDIGFVIQQARELEIHSYECKFGGALIFSHIQYSGLGATLFFKCSNLFCSKISRLHSDPEVECLNQLAVLGALSTGSGFSQEHEKFSIMNVTYMSKYVFASCERTTGTILDACVESNLTDFINEEKRLSQSRHDIDTDGYYCLTAVVDGGWCKRSYGHGYNASSGVAVIIGMATQKIIFIGIRNKICLICQAIEASRIPDKNHICYKNWNGSSTGMESDIIVEGVQFLETVHHIRCTRIVADGDSNIISSIQEKISYGGRVLKVECANHAVRRFGRALDKLQRDTKRFSGKKGIEARKV
ncbi:uncharacterized protein TNCT_24351 [Trichonephila clavata]|uniref:Mutator-like transposase domain-containing protein n=1 Tax=Trichonephila clavata TaxID=2740835 RepID=A0A8X6GUL8_TRICU|nr:uncharacterized protein TNCT_24351 [Trichonephila clavata]